MHWQGGQQIKQKEFLEEALPDLRSRRQDGVGQAKRGMEENLAAGNVCAKAHMEERGFA